MHLIFKRSQGRNGLGRVGFRLFAKLDLSEDEKTIVQKYSFYQTMLIEVPQPTLLRNSILVGLFTLVVLVPLIAFNFYRAIGLGWVGVVCVSVALAMVVAFIFYHQMRETIYVRDLVHGHYFRCKSICELVRKEAFAERICQYLRQVMESAKHWDGAVAQEIEPLPPEEAKRAILTGPLF